MQKVENLDSISVLAPEGTHSLCRSNISCELSLLLSVLTIQVYRLFNCLGSSALTSGHLSGRQLWWAITLPTVHCWGRQRVPVKGRMPDTCGSAVITQLCRWSTKRLLPIQLYSKIFFILPKQVTATFLPRLQFADPLFHGSLFKDLGLDKMKGWRPRETVCWSFKLGVIGWAVFGYGSSYLSGWTWAITSLISSFYTQNTRITKVTSLGTEHWNPRHLICASLQPHEAASLLFCCSWESPAEFVSSPVSRPHPLLSQANPRGRCLASAFVKFPRWVWGSQVWEAVWSGRSSHHLCCIEFPGVSLPQDTRKEVGKARVKLGSLKFQYLCFLLTVLFWSPNWGENHEPVKKARCACVWSL